MPACGFGQHQLAETDLSISQNKQTAGGNGYTQDSIRLSKDNVWHMHNTLSSSAGTGHFSAQSCPVIGWSSFKEDTDVQICSHESKGWCKWVMSYTDSLFQESFLFCSVSHRWISTTPTKQTRITQNLLQLRCQFLFLLSLSLSFRHFSPNLIPSHRRRFPLVSRVGDGVIP